MNHIRAYPSSIYSAGIATFLLWSTLAAVGCDTAPCASENSGEACDDHDPCTTGDKCQSEECVGTPLAVDDGDPCTLDACAEGEATHTPLIGDPTWLQCSTDITFYAMGDPQYGGGADDKNTFQITAMNLFPGTPWRPELPSSGQPVAPPLGVLIAGDLTQNGKDGRDEVLGPARNEIGEFVADYGLLGTDGALKWPVYEGYGNHDFDPDSPNDETELHWRYYYTENPTPSADLVAERNPRRRKLTKIAPDKNGHYSWDWGNVHLINANLFPGDEPSDVDEDSMSRNPRLSLTFLKEDLAENVGESGRPVIIMFHYGFDEFGHEARWWTDEQKTRFREAIADYNIIALVHGHTHATYRYTWEGYDVYNLGSPYYTQYNADNKGHFTAFRITDTQMEVSDVAWSPMHEGWDPHFTGWYQEKSLDVACLPENLPACP